MRHIQLENHNIAKSLLKRLIYFDIFSYPLSAKEVMTYCNYPKIKEDEGLRALKELKDKKIINCESDFYYLGNDFSKITRRLEDNRLASLRMKTAKKYATIVANFPYVRAVFISGSLSKNVMKPDSDIDFFIITKPGRLWLCRGVLTLFKKLFLGNSHRNFCINYFVDTNSLEIQDKNLYTATEIAFLLPMYNYPMYEEFLMVNNWYQFEYPNIYNQVEDIIIKPIWIKYFFESLMNNKLGDWVDQKCFSIITGFWRKKYHNLNEETFSFNFRSQKNVSKHHPNSFQNRVLRQYDEKITLFEMSTGLLLSNPIKKTIV
jgi:hypothetical protein